MSLRVGQKRYKLGPQIGAGAFGEIYDGVDTRTGMPVAVKLESVAAEHPQLAYEARVYQELSTKQGIPTLYYYGREGNYNVLVMERLGANLEELFNRCNRRFTLSTVLLLADRMLGLMQKVHDEGFVHRDIKPDNFLTGTAGEEDKLYIIDFGLSKCFWNPETDEHIAFRTGKHLTGTPRYASITNHKGCEQSRRDDLESLGYVLVYFLRGGLPWQKQQGKDKKQRYNKMMEGKESALNTNTLCRSLPAQFATYFAYVKNLAFDERPNYRWLREMFRSLYRECGYSRVPTFDWESGEGGSQPQAGVAHRIASMQPTRRDTAPVVITREKAYAGPTTRRRSSTYKGVRSNTKS